MDIHELERAVRVAVRQNPTQSALATFTSVGYLAFGQSVEFGVAIKTLIERGARSGEESILKDIAAKWM